MVLVGVFVYVLLAGSLVLRRDGSVLLLYTRNKHVLINCPVWRGIVFSVTFRSQRFLVAD